MLSVEEIADLKEQHAAFMGKFGNDIRRAWPSIATMLSSIPLLLAEVERGREVNATMLAALDALVNTMEHCSVTTGYCMCGDDMSRHPDPMTCGHSPVDMGQYQADHAYKAAHMAIAIARAVLSNGSEVQGDNSAGAAAPPLTDNQQE